MNISIKVSREQLGHVLAKAIGIGTDPPDPAELNSAKRNHHQGQVVHHGVGLAALVHPQPVVHAEGLLSLFDQGKLFWNVVSKWIPGQNLIV